MFQDSSLKEISTSEFSAPYTIGDYQPIFTSFEDSICEGDSSYMQISNYGSVQAIINSTSYSSVNDSSFYFLGNTSGLENVQFMIDSLGCSKSIDSSYTVFGLPSVNLGNDTTVCQGETIELTTIANGGQWEDMNHTSLSSTIVQINSDTSYVYMVSNPGCQNRDTIGFGVVNCLPIATDDFLTISEDTPGAIFIINNDSVSSMVLTAPTNSGTNTIDIDLSSAGTQIIASTSGGNWNYNASSGEIVYTPNPNFNGTDILPYELTDQNGNKDTAFINIAVLSVNDAPVVVNESLTTPIDTPINDTTVLGNGDNDNIDGGSLTVSTVPLVNSANGTITINSDGTFIYTPNTGFTGQDTIVVEVCDNGVPLPAICVNDTIFITVQSCDINITSIDCDGDGVINGQENVDGTDPNDVCSYFATSVSLTQSVSWLGSDCDGDGITNGSEVNTYNTDPLLPDTDGDGINDDVEITNSSDPNDPCSPNLPAYTPIADQSICLGETIDLSTLNSNGTWYDINDVILATNIVVANTSESYIVKLSSNNCTVKDTILVNALNLPVFTASSTEETCYNSMDGTISYTVVSAQTPYSFSTSLSGVFISSAANVSNLGMGNYDLIVTDGNGCSHTINQMVVGPTDTLAFDSIQVLPDNCSQSTGQIEVFGTSGGNAGYEYSLDNSNFSTNNQFTNLMLGNYTVYIKDVNECLISSTVTVNQGSLVQPALPQFNETLIKICEGNAYELIDIVSANSSLAHHYYFESSNNSYSSVNNTFILPDSVYDNSEVMYVYVNNGCMSDTAEIPLDFVSGDIIITSSNTEYCQGDSIVFNVDYSSGTLDSILWELDGLGDSVINQDFIIIDSVQEGTYSFLFHKSECTFQDSLTILFADNCGKGNVVTTTAFSPNGGLIENTTFNIDLDYINNEIPNIVTIYNRWGDVIYKVNDYKNEDNAWHGDNQSGDSMPEGTYFYVVEVPSKNFSTSGWIYLDLK